MLRIRKITAGDGYQYLLRQGNAVNPSITGRWMGRALASLGHPPSRDHNDPLIAANWCVREDSEVLAVQMKALFGEGLHPNAEKIASVLIERGPVVAAEAGRLGRSFHRPSAVIREAVAGFELTVTPVKSVSVVWALAPRVLARKIERAHRLSIRRVVQFLEENAAFARLGPGGKTRVDTTGLIIAAFERCASRAGDPNLHTRLAVSNKVCVIGSEGAPRWLALDGTALYRSTVAASEVYNTAIEGLLSELGFRFVDTPPAPDKRCVREIEGVPAELITRFSTRRRTIQAWRESTRGPDADGPPQDDQVATARPPVLDTRDSGFAPQSPHNQRRSWRIAAAEVLGGLESVQDMIGAACSHTAARPPSLDDESVDGLAAAVIARVSASRPQWRLNHVRAEAERQIRYANHAYEAADVIERVVAVALDVHSIAVDEQAGAGLVGSGSGGSSVAARRVRTVYSRVAGTGSSQ